MNDSAQPPFATFSPRSGVRLTTRFAGLFAFAATAGIAIVQAVGRWNGPRPAAGTGYFLSWPLERAFAGTASTAVVLGVLFTVGLACGLAHPRRAWLLGFASVALFPFVVAIEIACDGTSHNLFPFELVMFALLALPAVLGAVAGAGLRKLTRPLGGSHGTA